MKTWKLIEERPTYRVTVIIEAEESADIDGKGEYGRTVEGSAEELMRAVREAVKRGRLPPTPPQAYEVPEKRAKLRTDLGERDIPADIE